VIFKLLLAKMETWAFWLLIDLMFCSFPFLMNSSLNDCPKDNKKQQSNQFLNPHIKDIEKNALIDQNSIFQRVLIIMSS